MTKMQNNNKSMNIDKKIKIKSMKTIGIYSSSMKHNGINDNSTKLDDLPSSTVTQLAFQIKPPDPT